MILDPSVPVLVPGSTDVAVIVAPLAADRAPPLAIVMVVVLFVKIVELEFGSVKVFSDVVGPLNLVKPFPVPPMLDSSIPELKKPVAVSPVREFPLSSPRADCLSVVEHQASVPAVVSMIILPSELEQVREELLDRNPVVLESVDMEPFETDTPLPPVSANDVDLVAIITNNNVSILYIVIYLLDLSL
jgi:hypothetical protein